LKQSGRNYNGGPKAQGPPKIVTLDSVIPSSGLPSDLDAERFVLGTVLQNDAYFAELAPLVEAGDFVLRKHQMILIRMKEIFARGESFDYVAVASELRKYGELDACDGISYLVSLTDGLPALPKVDSYFRIIREKARLRLLAIAGSELATSALRGVDTSDELAAKSQERLARIGTDSTTQETMLTLGEIVEAFPGGIEALLGRGLQAQGISTGLVKFDQLTGGLQRGELVIIGGRPSMGKTALAIQIARNVADREGAAIFSLEMTREALLVRYLCAETRINSYLFRSGLVKKEDRARAMASMEELVKLPLYIDGTGGISLADINARLRRLRMKQPISLCVIDYLGLMSPDGDNSWESRSQEIGTITKGLKLIAKELNICVMLLCQLSRKCEERSDKRPILSDLRESGDIEQDADLVCFVYRDIVYNPNREDVRGLAELIVRKQRNGPLGTVNLIYLAEYMKFENRAEDYDAP
jgi:replicative DNA helicase